MEPKVLSKARRQGKEMAGVRIWTEEVNWSLLADNTAIYVDNPNAPMTTTKTKMETKK